MDNEFQFFPYQTEGSEALAKNPHYLLADVPGLGKTAQYIRACDLVGAENVLVLSPSAAVVKIAREFERVSVLCPPPVTVQSGKDFGNYRGGVCVTSYDLLAAHVDKLAGWRWDVVIADESHFLCNRETRRTKAAINVFRKSKRVWLVSGTPMRKDPSDLWVMFRLFGLYSRDYRSFVQEFCNGYEGKHGYIITGARQSEAPRLKKMLESVMTRRSKEEVSLQLPPIAFGDFVVPAGAVDEEVCFFKEWREGGNSPTKLHAAIQQQHELLQDIMGQVGGAGKAWLEALGPLQASTAALRRYVGLQKVRGVVDLLKTEFESGLEKVVLFAIHRDVIETLRNELRKYGVVTLYGGTPAYKRYQKVRMFQEDPKCRVFIGNIQAAGTALDLTAAHQVIFVEMSWLPADNAQAAMRCHRIGQKHPVFVRVALLDDNEVDNRVQRALKRRAEDAVAIGLV